VTIGIIPILLLKKFELDEAIALIINFVNALKTSGANLVSE